MVAREWETGSQKTTATEVMKSYWDNQFNVKSQHHAVTKPKPDSNTYYRP